MTAFSSGAYNAEEAKDFIKELRDFLSSLPNLQIKDLQMIGLQSENICLKLPMLEQHLRIKNNCYRCLKKDRDQQISPLGAAIKDSTSLKSHERIKDMEFIKKCLKQIEALE